MTSGAFTAAYLELATVENDKRDRDAGTPLTYIDRVLSWR